MISAKELREQSKPLNILYAEDEAMLRDSMKATLEKFFGKVFIATNGQEAFEIFKKEDVDLIMTDINMPIMSGTELIHNIQKLSDEDEYIIVLSAHNESKLLTKLINLGINNFLNKPLDKQLMINSLYKVCSTINDKKLLIEYETQLQNELEILSRKNKILEQKIKQVAAATNENLQVKKAAQTNSKDEPPVNESYFETLLLDDKEELQDLSVELDNYIAMMFQGEVLNEDYILKLSSVYKKYASVLNSYLEFLDIAAFLMDFSKSLLTLESKFMQDISQTGIYFESLQLTLENYREHTWNEKAKDPKFYNASLINDIRLIIDFLEDKEVQENEIEFF
ncbi:MAG: response regulator [Campylobacterota bacterium]|nr:response regulator [Campylobacterota bacterium]